MSFSIYDILNEAPEDENPETINTDDSAGDNTPAEEPDKGNDDKGADDDFSIDTDLDDDGNDDIDEDNGEEGSSDDIGDNNSSSGSDSDDEPVEANTDMFGSLSAEEQAIKISKLKQQYVELYDSCDSILEKISNIDSTETTIVPVSRIITSVTDLKEFIMDYLYKEFASKSFYENDVMFNRFLAIFKSISTILNNILKMNNRNIK